jgi:hypothetical protein
MLTHRIAGLAAVRALASPASGQLLEHKDLSLATALTIVPAFAGTTI